MKLYLPDNVFTKVLSKCILNKFNAEIIFNPSASISALVEKDFDSAGLIPTLDLMNYRELYVSKNFGLAFESSLCNSYIYFNIDQIDFGTINLFGDVSSSEILLTKILFKESYHLNVIPQIITNENQLDEITSIIVGDKNFYNGKFINGISFAEEIMELVNSSFTNYVFTSKNIQVVKEINKKFIGLSDLFYDEIERRNFNIDSSEQAKQEFINNISSVVIDLDNEDIEGVYHLFRLPYFHSFIDEIIDIKFI